MHVYFVRHGETLLNKKKIHQSPNTPLSPKGREQVETTAEYLRSVNPDLLLSSEYTRALETARIIGLHTGLTPEVQGLFYEIVRPSSLYEKSHFHIRTIMYVLQSIFYRNNPRWRFEDAENFADVSSRAQRAITHLESLEGKAESVIVVSHTVFINIMVSYLCKKKMLGTSDLIATFLSVERLRNAGVIHVEYEGKAPDGTCAWRLVDRV